MSNQNDQATRRTRVLEELYEHPEINGRTWIEGLGDDDLALLLSKIDDSDALCDLLDQLRTQADRER